MAIFYKYSLDTNYGRLGLFMSYSEAVVPAFCAFPSSVSISALTDHSIRVTFNAGPMRDNPVLRATSTYKITKVSDSSVLTITSVTPEPVTYPTYVDLVVAEEMVDGANYSVTVYGLEQVET